ncbi:NYN domain-containing protein [uncultured Mailhella sp.]|uniref:LabA-like NYN domain-containing protein n=1 Tax=uncultured Mailhella sp. TaxID=1981031 RepID=UPI0025FFB19D|nr:NYN domain-containing protein [uncultured Mailhella sp.]
MEKVTIFLDFANLDASAPGRIDYGSLLRYLGEGRNVLDAFAYVPVDPRAPQARDGVIRHLQQSGWMVNSKMGKIAGQSYKANVDVEMTIDIIQCAELVHPDIIVLCSGDGDFMPLIRFLRRRGVRLETAAFLSAASREVKTESSGFIDLDLWYRESCRVFPPFPRQDFFRSGSTPRHRDARFSEEEYAFLSRSR